MDSSAKQKPQGWEFLAVDAKKVNANANTSGSVKFSGKGIKLSSRRAEAVLA